MKEKRNGTTETARPVVSTEIVKRHAVVRRDGYDVPLIGIPEEAVLETCDCCGETIGLSTATFTGTQILCRRCAA